MLNVLMGGCAAKSADVANACEATGRRQSFADWIWRHQIASNGMCYYYRNGPYAKQISTVATAYAVLFFASFDAERAASLAKAMIAEQLKHLDNEFASGALPSVINDEAPFYSSDALISLKAMMATYGKTKDETYLDSARRFANFIMRMEDGERRGVLKRNLGVPMHYVTASGAYSNLIVPNISALFFDSLRDYGVEVGDDGVLSFYERGRVFWTNETQSPNGSFYDHYDPGYPAKSYDKGRWKFYSGSDDDAVVIADNGFMTALGCAKMGSMESAKRFLKWIGPRNDRFYGYLKVRDASEGFLPNARKYYDVVTSGMYRSLLREVGMKDAPSYDAARRFSDLARSPDGGYFWGAWENGGFVQDDAEALVTGYWCVPC